MQPATSLLREGSARLGVGLDDTQVAKLERYLELLLTWNRKINLTAVTEPEKIVERHFLDSLAVAPHLGPARTLLDAGAGAGFPGVVLAIARPDLRVTAVESIQKKAAFLETLRRELAPNVEVIAGRLEALPNDRLFDVAVSRATWDPPEWVERGAPHVAPGGILIAMQTCDQPPLIAPPGFTVTQVEYEIAGVERRLALLRHH
jgi:16S rRNA (guanine527-N7)-methyltransferase